MVWFYKPRFIGVEDEVEVTLDIGGGAVGSPVACVVEVDQGAPDLD